MNRRTVLAALAAATTGLGGCVGDGGDPPAGGDEGGNGDGGDGEQPDAGDTTPADDSTRTEAADDSETPDDQSDTRAVAETEFDAENVGCAEDEQRDEAEASADDDTVVVVGALSGDDGCASAELVEVEYDPEADLLSVTVAEARSESGDTVCAQCTSRVEYELRARLDNHRPTAVSVFHEDEGGGNRRLVLGEAPVDE